MAQVRTRKSRIGGRLGAGSALVLVAFLLVAALVGAFALLLGTGTPSGVVIERAPSEETQSGDATPQHDSTMPARLVVHVDGAVAVPGVYELALDAPRVNDAVEAAGGLLPEADTAQMNLAAELADGQKVHVPYAGESLADEGDASAMGMTDSGLININSATATELQGLSGVGEATARAIVEDRESNGPFTSIEDLMRVSGIGEKKFQKLRGQICV